MKSSATIKPACETEHIEKKRENALNDFFQNRALFPNDSLIPPLVSIINEYEQGAADFINKHKQDPHKIADYCLSLLHQKQPNDVAVMFDSLSLKEWEFIADHWEKHYPFLFAYYLQDVDTNVNCFKLVKDYFTHFQLTHFNQWEFATAPDSIYPASLLHNLKIKLAYEHLDKNCDAVVELIRQSSLHLHLDIILNHVNLIGVDFRNAGLSWSSLRNADLHGTNFQGANLRHVNFFNSQLYKANLQHTNLSDASFYKANLEGADLRHANLRNASFTEAILYNVKLEGAILLGADFRSAKLGNREVHIIKEYIARLNLPASHYAFPILSYCKNTSLNSSSEHSYWFFQTKPTQPIFEDFIVLLYLLNDSYELQSCIHDIKASGWLHKVSEPILKEIEKLCPPDPAEHKKYCLIM